MLLDHIDYALTTSPANNTERFLYFPALAIYSPIQDSVITLVGGIFTVLSVVTLGLCRPINRVADLTEHSQKIFTVPAQIFGNMFDLHSQTLQKFNDQSHLYTTKSWYVCQKLFERHTEAKIQELGRHIIFRASYVMNAISGVAIKAVFAPILFLVTTPLALYHRGREAKYNEIALNILRVPHCIHLISHSLRMVVNPLQFMSHQSYYEDEGLDKKPYWHALIAPGMIWSEEQVNVGELCT